VPEDRRVVEAIVTVGVPPQLAQLAVAITDRRHPDYDRVSAALFSSNPRRFADWFEQCARSWALPRLKELVKGNLYAAVEDVPAYEFKTPLQQAIQILKRHRDMMFRMSPRLAPISMVITNLAANAYAGEPDLFAALTNIVEKMPHFVRSEKPHVPNPANPVEDNADKWSLDPSLERSFWRWHTQVRADLKKLADCVNDETLGDLIAHTFGVVLSEEQLQPFGGGRTSRAPAIVRSPVLAIPVSTPRPWGDRHRF